MIVWSKDMKLDLPPELKEQDLKFIKICKRNGLTPLKSESIDYVSSNSFSVTRHFYIPSADMTVFISYVYNDGVFEISKISLEDIQFRTEMLINFGEVVRNIKEEIKISSVV